MNIGDKIKIISDNESYTNYMNQELVITHRATNENEHPGYDMSVYPQCLYDLKTLDGKDVPFSLYDYEIEAV